MMPEGMVPVKQLCAHWLTLTSPLQLLIMIRPSSFLIKPQLAAPRTCLWSRILLRALPWQVVRPPGAETEDELVEVVLQGEGRLGQERVGPGCIVLLRPRANTLRLDRVLLFLRRPHQRDRLDLVLLEERLRLVVPRRGQPLLAALVRHQHQDMEDPVLRRRRRDLHHPLVAPLLGMPRLALIGFQSTTHGCLLGVGFSRGFRDGRRELFVSGGGQKGSLRGKQSGLKKFPRLVVFPWAR